MPSEQSRSWLSNTDDASRDWTQWSSLQHQRSTSAVLMTTNHGPTHPYVILLFLWEMILGSVACAMVIIVFPNAPQFSDEFWFTASPAELTIWGVCIIGLILRLHVACTKKCPTLNKLLKSMEYQKWTESFDVPATKTKASNRASSWTKTYQYQSWWVIGALTSLGIALLAIGQTVDEPNL